MKGNHVANAFCKVFQINIYSCLFCFVEMVSYSVVQACLEPLVIVLSQPLECWDFSYGPSHPALH